MTTVRTRFAPSPTGYMHIGGMRTALFNWLWARHNEGQFVLRIDDTDQQRNIEEALNPILNAFRWLGLDWDEGPEIGGPFGPYFQSQRGELYQAAVQRLLESGKAYRCFDTPEQVEADRHAADKEKRNYLNIRRSLELSDSQIQQFLDEERRHVIRFLVPRDERVAIDDEIRGHIEWDCSLIPDPIIARANGSPLYNFATVVDDAQMQITHVIRAEEHLSNTPVQVLIHQGLLNQIPKFAHIAFVTAPGTNKKLSKRDIKKYRNNPQFKRIFAQGDLVLAQIGLEISDTLNPVMVEFYEKMGFLPAGVLNALSRLGWSLDDKTDILSRQTVIDNFTLDRVVKAPAGFDTEKLAAFQSHWMNELPIEQKVDGCLPFLIQANLIPDEPTETTQKLVHDLIIAMADRLKTFSDILNGTEFFVSDEQLVFDEKAVKKRLGKAGAAELVATFKPQLAACESFDAASLDRLMHEFVEAKELKIGEIIHAVRVAVTGKSVGIGLFDCMAILGRESCLARIDRALTLVQEMA